jgi:endonuclease VIII
VPEGDTIHHHAAARIQAVLAERVPDEILTPHPRHQLERWPQRLEGSAVRSVDAYGKHLFLRFDNGLTVHSHLRMSGAWDVYRQGQRWRRARRRATLVLRCGGFEVVEFDERLFLARLRADDPQRPIADALLNQRTVAGIGNVWKAECCFAVGVDPWRALEQVSDEEALALVGFAREHMPASAQAGFSARPHAVYKRASQPCARCGAVIRARGQGDDNRVTYWCPGCQH